jgi:hypothetical protein
MSDLDGVGPVFGAFARSASFGTPHDDGVEASHPIFTRGDGEAVVDQLEARFSIQVLL